MEAFNTFLAVNCWPGSLLPPEVGFEPLQATKPSVINNDDARIGNNNFFFIVFKHRGLGFAQTPYFLSI